MYRSILRGLGLAALVFACLGWQSDALARQGAKKSRAKAAKTAKVLTAAEIANALKSAHTLLVQADRDYAGHRALAAKEVQKALNEIGHRHQTAKLPTVVPTSSGAAPGKKGELATGHAAREAQATSDAQLQQAQQLLQQALSHMNARHAKAAANVRAAIGEITTALSIK